MRAVANLGVNPVKLQYQQLFDLLFFFKSHHRSLMGAVQEIWIWPAPHHFALFDQNTM